MRRAIALLLSLLLAVGLIACSQTPESVVTTEPTVTPTEPARKTIHVLVPAQQEGWLGAVNRAAMEQIAELEAKDAISVVAAEYDSAQQQNQLLEEIAAQSNGNGHVGVVLMPVELDTGAALEKLLEANVSYGLADVIPADAEAASVANVYYDQKTIGAAVAAYLTQKGLTQDNRVVILQGVTEVEAQRTDGFRLYLQGKLAVDGTTIAEPWESLDNIIYSEMVGTTRESAAAYFETFLSESELVDTRFVAAWDDEYLLGVLDALEGTVIPENNKERFLSGSPVLTGCGGSETVQQVLDGTAAYTSLASFDEIRTVQYSHELLKLAVEAMAEHMAGSVVEQDQPQSIQWLIAEKPSA